MKSTTIVLLLSFIAIYSQTSIAGDDEIKKTHDYNKQSLFQKLSFSGLSYEAFVQGIKGYTRVSDSLQTCFRYLCIADFVKPSSEKRMYIIDMQDSSLFHSDFVAHGRNSGELYAESFSNTIQSNQSSLGFYLISEMYDGKHGPSIRLDGIDFGFNDNARARAIVMHSAYYADSTFICTNGRLGRSQGCPALPPQGFLKVANSISAQSLLFIYYPNQEYLSQSVWLKDKETLMPEVTEGFSQK